VVELNYVICVCKYIVVSKTCCVVFFLLFVFVLCTRYCQFLWIVIFWSPLQYSLTFIYLVYPILPVSLNCHFLIAPSVFSNVYLSCVPDIASFSELPFFWLPLQYSLTFIYLVYPILPVSLNCHFLIAPSVFCNVYLSCVLDIASFSELSFFDRPFSIL
jgi:hypothetical protein